MAHLTDLQRSALQSAQILLDNVGLSPCDLNFTSPLPTSSRSTTPSVSTSPVSTPSSPSSSPSSPTVPCPTVLGTRYVPPAAQPFTDNDRQLGHHRFTRKSIAHAFVEHPVGAIIEYPQTGGAPDQSIAHIFSVDPNTFHSSQHPKASFQYSLGDGHGGHVVSGCFMLRDAQGRPVPCANLKTSCKILFMV